MNNQKTIIEGFRNAFGREPDLLIRACGRINLLGGHTDYNDGYVLPAAIDKHLYFAVGINDESRFRWIAQDIGQRFDSEDLSVHASDQLWANYLQGIVQQFQNRQVPIQGVDCVFGGNLPIGAGVSSSAAIEGGFGLALNTLFNGGFTKVELAQLAQRSSRDFVGVPCGIMDQFASLMGRDKRVIRLDCQSLNYEYFPFDTDQYMLLLLNSKVSHSLAESAYGTRVEECAQGLRIIGEAFPQVKSFRDVSLEMLATCRTSLGDVLYRRCDYVVREIHRVVEACHHLEEGDFHGLGQLMFQTHTGLRDDYEVSCEEIDFLIEVAKQQNEVLGARIMGGGFGGCTINLVRKPFVELFKSRARIAYRRRFGIELDAIPVNIVQGTAIVDVASSVNGRNNGKILLDH